ncbi:MAG: LacI family DNA-binding transcriptional regulator [Peptostreptococcus anaerobius]
MVKKEKVTIKMVADEAGVSKSTVSRVISITQISVMTLEKVRGNEKIELPPSAIIGPSQQNL